MSRYEVALRSPHVDIIAHPSGRKIGRRPDLDLDWDAFYRRAAETGTFLEINGSEDRLDLDEERIRAAREAGCRFTIDSDAHDPTEWQHLVWGTTIARRAWLEPDARRQHAPARGLPRAHRGTQPRRLNPGRAVARPSSDRPATTPALLD